jgi:hypothetical protein
MAAIEEMALEILRDQRAAEPASSAGPERNVLIRPPAAGRAFFLIYNRDREK